MEIKLDDLEVKRSKGKETARVMVYQLATLPSDWDIVKGRLYGLNGQFPIGNVIKKVLAKAKEFEVELLVFPELSIPEKYLELIASWSVENKNTVVVAGSHYFQDAGETKSHCPVVHNGKVYYTEKIFPAPSEKGLSPKKRGIVKGSSVSVFKNTPVGNFAVLVCSDNLVDDVKKKLEDDLDIWVVVAFQRDSDSHLKRIETDVETKTGRYVVYANNSAGDFADGRSALFGFASKKTLQDLKSDQYRTGTYKREILSLQGGADFYVADINIKYKRPFADRIVQDYDNVELIEYKTLVSDVKRGNLRPDKSPIQKPEKKKASDVIDSYHQFVQKHFLKSNMVFPKSGDDTVFNTYSSFFTNFLSDSSAQSLISEMGKSSLFDLLANEIVKTDDNNPILVDGTAGCGKTSFLSILYWRLYFNYIETPESCPFPIFISLHHYDKKVYGSNRPSYIQQAKKELLHDIGDVFDLVRQGDLKEVVVLVDGADEFAYAKVDLDDFLADKIEEVSKRAKVIGLRKYGSNGQKGVKKHRSFRHIKSIRKEIALIPVRKEAPNYENVIRFFAKIEARSSQFTEKQVYEKIDGWIKQFSIYSIDIFLLNMLAHMMNSQFEFSDVKSLNDVYSKHLSTRDIDSKKSAALAFKYFHKPGSVRVIDKNSREWWEIHRNESIRYYLVATYILQNLLEADPKKIEIFEYVYPVEVNTFLKGALDSNKGNQKSTVDSIKRLLPQAGITAKTHFCYILGRLTDPHSKRLAIEQLNSLKNAEKAFRDEAMETNHTFILTTEERKKLLYLRTIYISLTYLGDKRAPEEFVKQLLVDKQLNNLNRGFHLEYYQDIMFDPTSPDSLECEDNLGSCQKTFSRLSSKISKACKDGQFYSLFEIELFTLCSLVQHRQANGSLSEEMKERTLGVIDLALRSTSDLYDKLYLYVKFLKRNLESSVKYGGINLTREVYRIKDEPRTGWVKRNVSRPESVASHIYGVYMLGLLHLPDKLEGYDEYDKSTVLKMVLIHDIGEAWTGDIVKGEKTEVKKKEEQRAVAFLSLGATYDSLFDTAKIAELYDKYEHGIDEINSMVAKDLDKLDNLMQLYIYHESMPEGVPTSQHFRDDLVHDIKTELGRDIMRKIEDMFEDVIKNKPLY